MTETQKSYEVEIKPGEATSKDQDEKENNFQKPIDLDYILTNEVGQFGLFQVRIFLLIVLVQIFGGMMGEYIFSAAVTRHRCRIPECNESEKLHEFYPEWIMNSIPETEAGFASCERYEPVAANGSLEHCPANLFDHSKTISCRDFVYANNNTVVYEFDLGCNEWLRTLAGTLYNTGMLLALPIVGYMSDRFGRKIVLVVCTLNLGLFGFIRAFSVNYPMYLVLQIVQTILGSGAFSSTFILATELVGPKYRVITSTSCIAIFAMGEALLGVVAWLVPSWRYMIMATTVPCVVFVSYYWLISESVRWLISKKKYTRVRELLETMAKVNKTEISEKTITALLNPPQPAVGTSNGQSAGLVRSIIKSPIMLRRVCTTPVWWITMTFVYYGLTINSTTLWDTIHLNYILTVLSGIPGTYTSAFLCNTIGRKATTSSAFIISAACNICFVFIPRHFTIPRLVVYLFGKFFIAMVAASVYLYTSELYPTEYRHTLLGFSSMIGRIGSICAPLTPALRIYYHGLPSLLFGGMGLLAGLLVLTQPETLGCKLPNTMSEAEAVGKPESKITARG